MARIDKAAATVMTIMPVALDQAAEHREEREQNEIELEVVLASSDDEFITFIAEAAKLIA